MSDVGRVPIVYNIMETKRISSKGQVILPKVIRDSAYKRRYRMRGDRGYDISDHVSIWVLEENKSAAAQVETERERWLKFLKEAERFDETRCPTGCTPPR